MLESRIGYLLRRAQAGVRAMIDAALKEYRLNVQQFSILFAIDSHPGLSSADLARASTLTAQAVNLIVMNLESKGLMVRAPHPAHGRILQAELTRAGKSMLKRCKRRVFAIEDRMLADLPPAQEALIRGWLLRCAEQAYGGVRRGAARPRITEKERHA